MHLVTTRSDTIFQRDSTHFFQKYNYRILLENILLLSQDSWSVEWLINWFVKEIRALQISIISQEYFLKLFYKA